MAAPFWRRKTLAQMNAAEWESLCDGCGRCCLVKLEDEDDGTVHFTDIGCRLLDGETCRCRDYENRSARVSDCVRLTAQNLSQLNWLPPTCAYRLIAAGGDQAVGAGRRQPVEFREVVGGQAHAVMHPRGPICVVAAAAACAVEQAATDIGEVDGAVVLVLELDQAAAAAAVTQALPFRIIQLGERLGFPERRVHLAW